MENNKTKKYKIFGINIIDLLVILLIVGLAALVALYFSSASKNSTAREYSITYYADNVSTFVADKIHVGSKIADFKTLQSLGECTNKLSDVSKNIGSDAKGNFVSSETQNSVSLKVQSKYTCQLGERGGIMIDGKEMCVGDFVTILVGDAKLYIRIDDISPIGK